MMSAIERYDRSVQTVNNISIFYTRFIGNIIGAGLVDRNITFDVHCPTFNSAGFQLQITPLLCWVFVQVASKGTETVALTYTKMQLLYQNIFHTFKK